MKKNLFFLLLGFILLFGASCEEIGPNIDLVNINTGGNGTGEVRRVLIEEFTGVRCVNCPEGSKKIEDLIAIHGDKLIPVSIHAGFFAEPYPQSNYDFRTTEGTSLESNLLGPVSGYPAATINRKLFTGEFELPLTLNKWAGYISQDLQTAPKLTLDITNAYDTATRQLQIEVEMGFLSTVSSNLGISVMVLEDSIADAQLTSSGTNPAYTHRHVLRTMLTNYTGDPISDPTNNNTTLTRTYTFTLPTEWKASKCSIVAFVHEKNTSSKEVLQANYKKLY